MEPDPAAPPDRLQMTAYPEGKGPYERWELHHVRTGELLASGEDFPIPMGAIDMVVQAARPRLENS